jgi:hypothetical protein
MKKLIIILTLSSLFASCMSIEKAISYLEQKGKLDDVCANKFPVNESAASTELESLKPADNKDYSADFKELKSKMQDMDRSWEALLDSNTTAISTLYQREILKMQRQMSSMKEYINALEANYKPCKPDTAYIHTKYYVRDRAYEKTQSDSIQKLNDIISKKDERIAELTKDRNDWRKYALLLLGAIALYILIVLLLKRL